MNSTNETLLFDHFLIMYNLCVFTCIILIFVFYCTHVRMSYVLNSYLLTYLLTYLPPSLLIDSIKSGNYAIRTHMQNDSAERQTIQTDRQLRKHQ